MKEEIRKLLAGKILMVKPSGNMIRWIVTDAGPFVPCGWDVKRSTRAEVPVLPTQPERSVWSGDSIAFPLSLFPGWLFLSFQLLNSNIRILKRSFPVHFTLEVLHPFPAQSKQIPVFLIAPDHIKNKSREAHIQQFLLVN
ncbi:hypothetical protein OXV69_19425 [Bacteroides fragilis]|nr:hypothetical protein [Bacteroides fragilis]